MTLFKELKRRNVFRVGAAYVVTAWLLIQVAETIFPLFGFGDAPARIVVVVLAVGFIPALVIAWAFELTPEGIKLDDSSAELTAFARKAGRRLDRIIMAVLAIAVAYFLFDNLVLEPREEATRRQQQAAALETATKEARKEGRTQAIVDAYGDLSIAVLPFSDMSPDRDQEYFSDGIAEELLNLLARVPDLRVTSRTSSFSFKGQALEVPEIAKRLKVGHILEGSVRKAGDTIRITAQLIEARSDTHLWSETWDRTLGDVFAIQDEIARSVVDSLKVELLGDSAQQALSARAGVDPRAHELVLKARHLLHQQKPELLDQAESFLIKATGAAPDYAAAWGALARTLKARLDWTQQVDSATEQRLNVALERALTLDPGEPDALATKGKILLTSDEGVARAFFLKALEINPNDPDAYRWLALTYFGSDDARFLELLRKAYLVDPTNIFTSAHMVNILIRFGRFDEAHSVARDFHRVDPDSWMPFLWAGDIYRHQGEPDRALNYLYHAYRVHPDVIDHYARLAFLLVEYDLGDHLIASWLEEWKRRAGDRYLRPGSHLGPEIVFLIKTDRAGNAIELINNAQQAARIPEWLMGYVTLRARGEDEQVRAHYERAFGAESFRESGLDLSPGAVNLDYIVLLRNAGQEQTAFSIAARYGAELDEQMRSGLLFDMGPNALQLRRAQLSAVMGDREAALAELHVLVDMEVLICLPCIDHFPHLDGLRGLPEFEAIRAELAEQHSKLVNRLRDQDLLLTPEEVMARGDSGFVPFAD